MRKYNKEISKKYGDFMSAEDWESCVDDGLFVNYDGHGYWCKDDKASDGEVFNSPRLDATHVIWFNK
jgi:hypothetical protein